ncbi:hypothetical protein [Streptomyces corynorhini]|uniref:Uncharacterized protein n=1 Tax=Streptomyces corynorhini TaxID=2282652 RepID=A0A370BB40_9ACTN|nr:hypothetical protein [Streptomyces corynorhini]RDG36916.1 hypothetical protein DVH02_17440 [Streptomyces corynorhini]
MSWYTLVPCAVMAVCTAVAGTAAIRTGWLFPWLRGRLFRPVLFGRGLLVMAAAFVLQLVGGLFIEDPDVRLRIVDTPGIAGLLISLGMITIAQVPVRDR